MSEMKLQPGMSSEKARIYSDGLRGGQLPAKTVSPQRSWRDNFWKRRWWQVAIAAVLVAAVGYLVYGYANAQTELARLNGGSGSEVQSLVNQIGRYLVLPDEAPTLATVNDVSKLKNQEFFKNAQNGDKVLIFSKAGRALLYRVSTKKIIEYSKVDLSSSGTGSTP